MDEECENYSWMTIDRLFMIELCHGMTKSVKVHRKDQSVNKNAILPSFVCFFNFPDRNLIILYKIT